MHKKLLAYFIGLALGDENLSNPNGRAVRLRITRDKKYPLLILKVKEVAGAIFPENKVGCINRTGCVDVSVYSNLLEGLLGWRWNKGPKDKQNVGVPVWIKENRIYVKECLRGLLQTDGCIYKDRGYTMINFTNTSPLLTADVLEMMTWLDYEPNVQKLAQQNGKTKYTIRLTAKSKIFIKDINFWKK